MNKAESMNERFKIPYINNTGCDVRLVHAEIMKAIDGGGKFDKDLADIFCLRKTPAGSACKWVLEEAETT